jgi:magnesium chelatase family protein
VPPVLATLLSATLSGITGRPVRVEVDVAPGLPGFTIVGLPDAALSEARERVRGALRNAGYHHPPRRITVNLAPADLRKAGASLDLAIAIGILLGSEQLRAAPGRVALIGELGLGGEVRPVPGILPMALALEAAGVRRVLVPAAAAAEAGLVRGLEVVGVASVTEAAEAIRARRSRLVVPMSLPRADGLGPGPGDADPVSIGDAARIADPAVDLADVRGQAVARRALEIALAGGHAMLLIGPPGAGKTLLARTIPGLLPDLDDAAALAATVVASVGPGAGDRRSARPTTPCRTRAWWAAGRGCRRERSPSRMTACANVPLCRMQLRSTRVSPPTRAASNLESAARSTTVRRSRPDVGGRSATSTWTTTGAPMVAR